MRALLTRQVCTDLKQWLEQLAQCLSVYHVHILDLEGAASSMIDSESGSQRRLSQKVEVLESQVDKEKLGKEDAVRRFEDMQVGPFSCL